MYIYYSRILGLRESNITDALHNLSDPMEYRFLSVASPIDDFLKHVDALMGMCAKLKSNISIIGRKKRWRLHTCRQQ